MPDILYDDDDIIVVSKPAGMPVHSVPGHKGAALCDELLKPSPEMRGVGSLERSGVVHRLDIETSGVMVFARNQRSYLFLRREFENHNQVEKTYLAVLHGAISPRKGRLETQLAKRADKKRMRVVETGGQSAITHWEVLSRQGSIALAEFRIETGRTHQIRVHAAHLGHPIVGDRIYGDAAKDARLRRRPSRMLLHAVELSFKHPSDGKRVVFAAEVPPELVYAG